MNKGGTPENLIHYKSGDEWTGNAEGRPPLKKRIEEMQEKLGDFPRAELMRIANDGRTRLETRARILMHLDDKFTGKAPQQIAVGGTIIVRSIGHFYGDIEPGSPRLLEDASEE